MSDRTDLVERMRDNEKIQAESIEELLEAIDADEEQTIDFDSYDGQEEGAESSVELTERELYDILRHSLEGQHLADSIPTEGSSITDAWDSVQGDI